MIKAHLRSWRVNSHPRRKRAPHFNQFFFKLSDLQNRIKFLLDSKYCFMEYGPEIGRPNRERFVEFYTCKQMKIMGLFDFLITFYQQPIES